MKKLFSLSLIALALSFLTIETHAQRYDLHTATITSNSVTITAIEASITNTTVRASIPATRDKALAVQCTIALAGSGTSAVVCKFDESLDGTYWTSAAQSMTITASGTNIISKTTNFDIGAKGYWRLSSVENPNAQVLTLGIKYAQKLP